MILCPQCLWEYSQVILEDVGLELQFTVQQHDQLQSCEWSIAQISTCSCCTIEIKVTFPCPTKEEDEIFVLVYSTEHTTKLSIWNHSYTSNGASPGFDECSPTPVNNSRPIQRSLEAPLKMSFITVFQSLRPSFAGLFNEQQIFLSSSHGTAK